MIVSPRLTDLLFLGGDKTKKKKTGWFSELQRPFHYLRITRRKKKAKKKKEEEGGEAREGGGRSREKDEEKTPSLQTIRLALTQYQY